MSVLKLKRNAAAIQADLRTLPDKSMVTSKGCKIHIPAKYFDKNLGLLGDETYILGVFAIQVGESYAVERVTSLMQISPTGSSRYTEEGMEFIEFYFAPGSVVFVTVELVVRETLPYDIFDFYHSSGYVPYYFTPMDLGNLFEYSGFYANLKLGADRSVLQLMAATQTRDPKDKTVYWRHTLQKQVDVDTKPYTFVPFSSVLYGATNTVSRLMGAYYDEGLVSALVNPSERVEDVERLLRA